MDVSGIQASTAKRTMDVRTPKTVAIAIASKTDISNLLLTFDIFELFLCPNCGAISASSGTCMMRPAGIADWGETIRGLTPRLNLMT